MPKRVIKARTDRPSRAGSPRRPVALVPTTARSHHSTSGRTRRSPTATHHHATPPGEFVPLELRLRTITGHELSVRHTPTLQRAAMEWSYVLRNRRRWTETPSAKQQQSERSAHLLGELGVGKDELRLIAAAKVAEVEIPWRGEGTGWEARLLPWEFLLSSATKPYRQEEALTVVRWLRSRDGRPALQSPETALYVESAPGKLSDLVTFETERELVRTGLGLEPETLLNPTCHKLISTIAADRPDIVHLAGVDPHQAAQLGVIPAAPGLLDGFVLARPDGRPEACDAGEIAAALTSGGHRPRLVAINLYRSASRTAALAVAAGARGAIGFQDVIDDASAEVFWSNFYGAWRVSKWDLLSAFVVARLVLRDQPQTQQGNGIVLWSDTSLLGGSPARPRAGRPAARKPASADTLAAPVRAVLEEAKQRPVSVESVAGKPDRDLVGFSINVLPRLNYSMLHNERPLFEAFRIEKRVPGRLEGVLVEVTLDAGPDPVRYSASFDLDEAARDLASEIRLPLTSTLLRSATESIRTNLSIVVRWHDRELCRRSHPVTLLPIDEWLDTDGDRMWLPSFVQPRDPAVLRVIQSGHRYLAALTDDLGAGFDGYQSHDPEADDPDAGVDMQVQALWSALLQDFGLHYINPPPSSTDLSQRLRSHSDVITGRQGTCIDLALLLCACLEHVDIHPAMILLEGHAFPAYWRSESAHERFQSVTPSAAVTRRVGPSPPGEPAQRYPWYAERWAYPEILQQVRQGRLVPLETVSLTDGTSFAEAVDEGFQNLRSQRDFNSLIDIVAARQRGVTPLPVVRGV